MRVLGLSFSGHGSSICLVEDGKIVRAVNLERLTRKKFSLVTLPRYEILMKRVAMREFQSPEEPEFFNFFEVFPRMLRYVTGCANLADADIDLIVKTRDNVGRIVDIAYKSYFDKAYKEVLQFFAGVPQHLELEHHMAHAYQAYLSSPFDEAAILTVDGTGEKLERLGLNSISTTFCVGQNNRVRVLSEVYSPFSIGGVYSNFTRHLGFMDNQEGKTMALASFGTDSFFKELNDTWELLENGHFKFTFNELLSNQLIVERMQKYVEQREYGGPIHQKHKDMAWAIQNLTEIILVHAANAIYKQTGLKKLALAGGVGLNCVANAKVLSETPFEEMYIMPNAGDRGLSVGCALFGYQVLLKGKERVAPINDYFGRSYSEQEILTALNLPNGYKFRKCKNIASVVAGMVAEQKIVGWYQGGAEFGPRALGNRSIIADPRTLDSKVRLDNDIKRREWFRPYAPSVLEEYADEYFVTNGPSPYMLMAVQTRPEVKEKVEGIVHVDGTARIQTVNKEASPRYYNLISEFHKRTGIPLVLNTSFNANGEPIVETPTDALDALKSMKFDALALGDYLVWDEQLQLEGVN